MHKIISNNFMRSLVDKLRNTKTGPAEFYGTITTISQLLAYEALKEIEYAQVKIPIWAGSNYDGICIEQGKIVILPILRAGIGMLDGIRHLLPAAQVQVLGMYRNEKTLKPVWYYNKLPDNMHSVHAFLIDPMLATGGSMLDAVRELKRRDCYQITVLAVVASPEGLEKLNQEADDINIFVASLDSHLNQDGYIIPGLGDAGDRIFNT